MSSKRKEWTARWIRPAEKMGEVCPVFSRTWQQEQAPGSAVLYLTALGVYEAQINGKRVGDYVLAPGWTVYEKRLQYQEYDVTELIREGENEICVTLGKGWFSSRMPGWKSSEDKERRMERDQGILGELILSGKNGENQIIATDQTWKVQEGPVRFSEIYDGESYDASLEPGEKDVPPAKGEVCEFSWPMDTLIPQEGEQIKEMERVGAKKIIRTPAGEWVVDFGQNITGYVEFTLDAHKGDKIRILHGEILDKDGNFYNENYRSAKAEICYICKEGRQTWHPRLTFFGFRYLKLEEFPGEPSADQFTAIAVYSDMKQTGFVRTAHEGINQLFSNVLWGQKGNFLDVPTDCPQRDERLGWTGDAQTFTKAAAYNFDVATFFRKWLRDLAAEQLESGSVPQVIPNYLPECRESAAWGDAATICPWQIYMTYGNVSDLEEQFESMKKWVDFITGSTTTQYLWTGGEHFGDWVGLDAPVGSYRGASREDFIATAFYARSAQLTARAGRVLGKDMSEYEALFEEIRKAFRKAYPEYLTQTEHILAVWFELAEDPQKTADALADMIVRDGTRIMTGFVGTPYILHVLSNYGHTDLAYSLLLREEYPSWLYPVRKGATTIWEHWDGIMEDGSLWSPEMNSFNHYSYGSVADWLYEEAAGIKPVEEAPGFAGARITPKPDKRLGWIDVTLNTRHGQIRSAWKYVDDQVRFEITTPVRSEIVIGDKKETVEPGSYTYWG